MSFTFSGEEKRGELLDSKEQQSIFTIIDMAITKKRLKDTLSNALNSAM